ncbi:MAG: hypothetical protein ACREXP_24660 [Steroidobacteraceae bacterium]
MNLRRSALCGCIALAACGNSACEGPLTHFVELVRGIVLRGAGLVELQVPIYKLFAFTAVALKVVTLRFHKRLD